MSVLVTETTVDQPNALIVSDDHILANDLTHQLRQADFAVTQWGRVEVLSLDQRGALDLNAFDKIIIVLLGSLKDQITTLAKIFGKHQSKLWIIAPFTSSFSSSDPYAQELVKQTHYLNQLGKYVLAEFSQATCILLEDVWYPPNIAFTLEQWLLRMVQPSHRLLFTGSPADFYPQSLDLIGTAIQKVVFGPNKREKYLVRGKKRDLLTLTSFLQAYIQKNIGSSFEVAGVTRESNVSADVKTLLTPGVSEVELVQPIVLSYADVLLPAPSTSHIKPIIKKSAEIVRPDEKPYFERKGFVTPAIIPLIENRMKKYEKKMQELAQRKKVSSLRKKRGPTEEGLLPVVSATNQWRLHKAKTVEEKALEEEITRIFGSGRVQKKVSQVKKRVKDKKHLERKNTYRSFVGFFMAIVVGMALGMAVFLGSFVLTKKLTVQAITSLADRTKSGEPIPDKELKQLNNNMSAITKVLSFEVETYRMIFGKDKLQEEELLVSLGEELPKIQAFSTEYKQRVISFSQQFFNQQPGDAKSSLTSISADAEEAYKRLSLLQNQVKAYTNEIEDPVQVELLQQFTSRIQDQRKLMAVQIQLQQALPSLLGIDGRKTYAILLQNNQELRPTGGLIQAVALITVDKGVLIDTQVFDVSELDKMFSGQVSPPPEVQSYLGEKNWSLRDANWDPDFPQTSQQVVWFLEKMLGKKVDGVVGINLYVLQDMLKAIGPVSLPEYNETLSEKNFLDRVEFHSEIKLVQSGRTEYLSTVFNKILGQVTTLPPEKVIPLLSSLYGDLKSRQATVFVNQPDKNVLLANLGWGGEISTPQCPAPFNDQPCITDTFYQTEANIGINKANFTLERNIRHLVTLNESSITHQRVISLRNTSTSNAWPLGAYKAYIRFYVPDSASLQMIKINDTVLQPMSVVVKPEHGKKYFGVPVEVGVGETKNITLTYSEPLASKSPFSYVFFEQKQPGTGSDPYTLAVQFNSNLHPAVIAPQAEVEGQMVSFTNAKDKNLFMGLKFN